MTNARFILKWGGALLLALPALALVAFGPRAGSELPRHRVVVTYWEKWTDFEGETMRRLCAAFNETDGREKGIYVDYVITTQIELKTLVTATGGDAAKKGPTVAACCRGWRCASQNGLQLPAAA